MQEKDSGVKDLSGAGDGADEISGATNEEKGSCLEVLGERSKCWRRTLVPRTC